MEWDPFFPHTARVRELSETPTGRQVVLKWIRNQDWAVRRQHLPLTPAREPEMHGSTELPHVCYWEERGYKHRFQNILYSLERDALLDLVRYGENPPEGS